MVGFLVMQAVPPNSVRRKLLVLGAVLALVAIGLWGATP